MQKRKHLQSDAQKLIYAADARKAILHVAPQLAYVIDNIPAADVPRWIPVTERMPELIPCGTGTAYSEAVNILTSGRKVLTAIWNGTDWISDAEFWEAEGEAVTHWAPVPLPLPAPPKEA